MTVSVITASLPTRSAMLGRACASVAAQRLQPLEHLISVDYQREGSAEVRRALATIARGEWLAFLDDDDVLYPQHLSELVKVATVTGADVVYPYCDVVGRGDWNPSRPFDAEALEHGNYIPITCLVRKVAYDAVGGFRPYEQWPERVQAHDGGGFRGHEDWDLWLRILDADGRIVCHPERTWLYRQHEGSKTFVGEAAAR